MMIPSGRRMRTKSSPKPKRFATQLEMHMKPHGYLEKGTNGYQEHQYIIHDDDDDDTADNFDWCPEL